MRLDPDFVFIVAIRFDAGVDDKQFRRRTRQLWTASTANDDVIVTAIFVKLPGSFEEFKKLSNNVLFGFGCDYPQHAKRFTQVSRDGDDFRCSRCPIPLLFKEGWLSPSN